MLNQARDSAGMLPAELYRRRLARDLPYRRQLWAVLCRDWFQQFIPTDACVVELAAGYCEFINQIKAGRRIAVDINPDTRLHAEPGVEVLQSSASDVGDLADASVDVVFFSNFLEHLTKAEAVSVLTESRRLLKPGGRLMILQPNIRYLYRDYWMFYDHITPVDDRALCEALECLGYRILQCIPRFLPFTTVQSRYPRALVFVQGYLRCRFLWPFLGRQAFLLAEKGE